MEIGLYSSGNFVGVLPFGIGVTLAILHDSEKLPEVKRVWKILASFRDIKSALFFKNKENILPGLESTLESSSFK